MTMTFSPACTALVRHFEGCRLEAYQDSAGVWTIGYGHTGPEVKEGLVWGQEQAEATLASDLANTSEFVYGALPYEIPQQCFDALVSFAFNLGNQSLKRSTLLAKVNQQDWFGAAQQFGFWCNAGGKPVKGLLIRRLQEAELFAQGL